MEIAGRHQDSRGQDGGNMAVNLSLRALTESVWGAVSPGTKLHARAHPGRSPYQYQVATRGLLL